MAVSYAIPYPASNRVKPKPSFWRVPLKLVSDGQALQIQIDEVPKVVQLSEGETGLTMADFYSRLQER